MPAAWPHPKSCSRICPKQCACKRPLALDPGISEYEIVEYFKQRAAETATGYASFLGAGMYNHYRPVLVDTVVSRGEFLTSYTPYQAEIAQGTLTDDLRISDHDLPAHRHGRGQRFHVRRLDCRARSCDDGRPRNR